jgi:acetyl/propionyl-CoA carboxylase alpha subunit
VQAQIRIAAGEPLPWKQEDIVPRGHAIECRICAEDPAEGFLPRPGRILALREPQGPGIRVDSGIRNGYTIPLHYDPLLSKLCAWGSARDDARRRMIAALRDYTILGCPTGIPFLLDVLRHPAFISGETQTHFIQDHLPNWTLPQDGALIAALAAAVDSARTPRPTKAGSGEEAAASPWTTLGPWRIAGSEPL